MLIKQGTEQPVGWGNDPARVWRDDTHGVHQIRLHNTATPGHTWRQSKHRNPQISHSHLEVACNCGAHLGWIQPGGDCWTPFNEHLRSVNDNH